MILDYIYPPVCGFCGKINQDMLCKKCEGELKKLEKLTITKHNRDVFNEQAYFFEYKGFIRSAILRYKFNSKSFLYKSFAKFMIKNVKFMEFLKSYDIIIPVPISKQRKMNRGYNQSFLISREIAKKYNWNSKNSKPIKVRNNCLYKVKNTVEQSSLNKYQREKNVKNAYIIKEKQILKNKRILIIDDVFTTGNTIREICKEIKKANPEKIGVLTIARD